MARWAFAALVALASLVASAASPGYPNKPIKMIVPFAPGGASDFVARIITPPLSQLLGAQIIIENKPGASGNIGMEEAAKAAPDGYTVFLGNIGTIAINPAVFRNLTVHPVDDFAPITLVSEVPSILIARPNVGIASVADLVSRAKAKPGGLNFASPGVSTLNRLEMERFMKETGTKLVHVPYKGGAGQAVTGMLTGDTEVMFVTLSSAMTFVKSGQLRALAVASPKRLDMLPDVPTIAEAGFPDLVSSSWQGLFAPAGTPKAIVDKLHAAMLKVLAIPEVAQRFGVGGALVVSSQSPEDFRKYVADEAKRWGEAVKESGIVVD